MAFEIKHCITGVGLYTSNTAIDLAGALMEALKSRANLYGANLSDANLSNAKGIYSFGPIGREKRIGQAVTPAESVMVKLGCFWGTEAEALEAIAKKYGVGSLYADQVWLACKIVAK